MDFVFDVDWSPKSYQRISWSYLGYLKLVCHGLGLATNFQNLKASTTFISFSPMNRNFPLNKQIVQNYAMYYMSC